VSWVRVGENAMITEYVATFNIHGLIAIREMKGMRIQLPEKGESYN
jgi:hypothetical protein